MRINSTVSALLQDSFPLSQSLPVIKEGVLLQLKKGKEKVTQVCISRDAVLRS